MLITASIVAVATDRRVLLVSMALQYILAGLLFSQIVPWRVATVKVMSGLFSCLVLLATAWRTGWRPTRKESQKYMDTDRMSRDGSVSRGSGLVQPRLLQSWIPLRVFAVAMICLLAFHLQTRYEYPSRQIWLPDAPEGVIFAVLQMVSLGLLVLGLTEDPLHTGLGLLMVLIGFGLFYSLVEPALAVIASLAAIELSVALVCSYLTIIETYPEETTSEIYP